MRRVVITGIGIISPIGNNAAEVEASLRAGKSGIVFAPEYAERGFRSQVHGMPQIVLEDHIDKRNLRFMGPGAAYNFLAMEQAIADSGLEQSDVSNERTGLVMGSGGPSTSNFFEAHRIVMEKGAPKRIAERRLRACGQRLCSGIDPTTGASMRATGRTGSQDPCGPSRWSRERRSPSPRTTASAAVDRRASCRSVLPPACRASAPSPSRSTSNELVPRPLPRS